MVVRETRILDLGSNDYQGWPHLPNNTVQMLVSPQISRILLFVDARYYDCGNMPFIIVVPPGFGRRRSGYEVRYGGAQSA